MRAFSIFLSPSLALSVALRILLLPPMLVGLDVPRYETISVSFSLSNTMSHIVECVLVALALCSVAFALIVITWYNSYSFSSARRSLFLYHAVFLELSMSIAFYRAYSCRDLCCRCPENSAEALSARSPYHEASRIRLPRAVLSSRSFFLARPFSISPSIFLIFSFSLARMYRLLTFFLALLPSSRRSKRRAVVIALLLRAPPRSDARGRETRAEQSRRSHRRRARGSPQEPRLDSSRLIVLNFDKISFYISIH